MTKSPSGILRQRHHPKIKTNWTWRKLCGLLHIILRVKPLAGYCFKNKLPYVIKNRSVTYMYESIYQYSISTFHVPLHVFPRVRPSCLSIMQLSLLILWRPQYCDCSIESYHSVLSHVFIICQQSAQWIWYFVF